MTISAVSIYRGGTMEQVLPVSRRLKTAYGKHGVAYRLSRFETGPNAGDWLVIVQYVDTAAYATAQAAIAHDADCQSAFVEISQFAQRVSRELVVDVDV